MRRLAVLMLAAAVIAAGAPPPARAQELPLLRIGITTSAADAPLWIADRLGYFREDGIRVQFLAFQSGETMLAPLSSGQLDVAGGAPAASLYNAVARGLDVRLVADLASDPPGYGYDHLVVRSDLVKSGRFKTIKDLKGMTIASVARGSTAAPLLAHLLAKAGLKLTDVRREYLAFPQHVVALRNKAVDAAMTIEPFATYAADEGIAVKEMSCDEFYPNQQISAIMFGGNLLRAHRDVGQRFMHAYLRGVRFYNDALAKGSLSGPNAPEVIKVLTEETKLKDAAMFRRITPSGSNPDGHVFIDSLRGDLAFFKQTGLIEGNVTVDQVVDDSFATAAVKALGPYKPKAK